LTESNPSFRRVEEIEEAYAYCVEHDRWPDNFFPFNAIRDLLADIHGYRRALVAHHDIGTLSDDVLHEYDFRECPVCKKAR
jgi:hypothetical protein